MKGDKTMSANMSEKDYIKMLKERDKPMPMKQYFWQTEQFKDDPPIDLCGACGETLGIIEKFCGECGQRIDRENYQL